MTVSVKDMTTEQLANIIVKFAVNSKREKLVRSEYLERVEAGEEGDDRIEVCPGRTTQIWTDTAKVLRVLVDISECMDVPIDELIQPVAPGKLTAALKKRKIAIPEVLTDSLESKTGASFTRLKPQADPEQFRD